MHAVRLQPAITAALHSMETLLVLRQDVLRGVEEHAASHPPADSAAELDAELARLTATADRLAADIERLLAELNALVPPDGRRP